MTPDERLLSAYAKIATAKDHIKRLEAELAKFFSSRPYTVATKLDPSTHRLTYFLSGVRPLPISVSTILGDALQNLRSALDHLAYQLFLAGTGGTQEGFHIYFPIFDSAADYAKGAARKIRGLRAEAIRAIDEIKPYRGGNGALWRLHKLNNADKHRLLLTVGARYESMNICAVSHSDLLKMVAKQNPEADLSKIPMMDVFLKPQDTLFPLKLGDELFTDTPDAEPNPQIQFRFQVVLNEPDVAEGMDPLQTFKEICESVEKVISDLRPLLSTD